MKALLVVDVQNGLVERDLFQKDRFLTVVENAIQLARRYNHLIIGIQHTNNQLVEGTAPWMIYGAIGMGNQDLKMKKRHGNAFEETNLKHILLEKSIKDVAVCGLVSHGCVRATCLGAMEEGFNVTLLNHGHSCWNRDASEKIVAMEKELEENGIKIEDADKVFI